MIGVTRVKGEIQREEGMSREKGMKLPTLDGDLGITSTCAGGHVSFVSTPSSADRNFKRLVMKNYKGPRYRV